MGAGFSAVVFRGRQGRYTPASVGLSAISVVAPGDNTTTELRNLSIRLACTHSISMRIVSVVLDNTQAGWTCTVLYNAEAITDRHFGV